MPKHPPATRWEPCSNCGLIFPTAELLHISEALPSRKRGWLCSVCLPKLAGRRLSVTL